MKIEGKEFVTVSELRTRFEVSDPTIRRWLKEMGMTPSIKIGGIKRYDLARFENLIMKKGEKQV